MTRPHRSSPIELVEAENQFRRLIRDDTHRERDSLTLDRVTVQRVHTCTDSKISGTHMHGDIATSSAPQCLLAVPRTRSFVTASPYHWIVCVRSRVFLPAPVKQPDRVFSAGAVRPHRSAARALIVVSSAAMSTTVRSSTSFTVRCTIGRVSTDGTSECGALLCMASRALAWRAREANGAEEAAAAAEGERRRHHRQQAESAHPHISHTSISSAASSPRSVHARLCASSLSSRACVDLLAARVRAPAPSRRGRGAPPTSARMRPG
jgi:hypothetical protein